MSYYEKEYPDVNEVVYVRITKIQDDSIYCKLIEYGDKEGFLPITDLDKKSQANPKKYFNENKIYPMTVMRINKNNGTIDLNYNRIKADEREKYVEKFEYFVKIFKFTSEISLLSNLLMEKVLPATMWKLVQKCDINNSKEIYNTILDDPASYMEDITSNYPDLAKKTLDNVESRITRSRMIIHQEIKLFVTCQNAINVLKEILSSSSEDIAQNIKIEYVNAPKYRIVVEGKTNNECDEKLNNCLESIKKKINGNNSITLNMGSKTTVKENEITFKNLAKHAKIE